MRRNKPRATFFMFSFFFVFWGCEIPYSEYGTWDKDNDKLIVKEEFNNAFFSAKYFETGDLDSNNYIDEEEWKEIIVTYIPSYNFVHHGNFADWDQDADNLLNEDEFSAGTFKLWDNNNDGKIDESEYEEWHYELE